ncbi:MAG: hypothetical protein QXL94_07655 [Candidatus Parvarchaeum sp.]
MENIDMENIIEKWVMIPYKIVLFLGALIIGFLWFLSKAQYTAAATWILAISTVALALITYNLSNKQYKKALIEKQLEEFYIPLIERLTYPLGPLNGRLTGDINERIFQAGKLRDEINKILRIKGYLSDTSLYDLEARSHYIFKGSIGGNINGKAQWEKWSFDTKEETVAWVGLLKNLYRDYQNLVRDYYHLSGRDIKIQAYNKKPEEAFEIKSEGGKDWL